MPLSILVPQAVKVLDVEAEHIKEGVIELAYTQKIHVEKDNNDINVYLMPYYMAENGVCREMIRLSQVDFEDLK